MTELIHVPRWLSESQANLILSRLQGLEWEHQEVRIFGQRFPMPRLTHYRSSHPYVYSGLTHHPQSPDGWMQTLMSDVDVQVERRLHKFSAFNSLLFNKYRSGFDSISWHSDDEEALGPNPIIASLSFGATRAFAYRPKSGGESKTIDLSHGDLLIMPPGFQATHQHALPKRAKAEERISITFRTVL